MSVLISLTIDWMNIGGFDGIDEFTEKLAILLLFRKRIHSGCP